MASMSIRKLQRMLDSLRVCRESGRIDSDVDSQILVGFIDGLGGVDLDYGSEFPKINEALLVGWEFRKLLEKGLRK